MIGDRRTEIAAAGASTAVNAGITAGAFLGSIALPAFGVRSTALVGGLLSLAALAVVFMEPWLASTPGAQAPSARARVLEDEQVRVVVPGTGVVAAGVDPYHVLAESEQLAQGIAELPDQRAGAAALPYL